MPNTILTFSDLDYVFLAFGTIFAAFFTFLGEDKIYKCYFGIIIGFLLFQLINQEITILGIIGNSGDLSAYERFLQRNSSMMILLFSILIPFLGLFLTINSGFLIRVKGHIFGYIIFGFLFPFFLLGISVYITVHATIKISFLTKFGVALEHTFFYNFFASHLYFVFLFIFFFLFYRIMGEVVFNFSVRIGYNIISQIKEKLNSKLHTKTTYHHKEGSHHSEEE